MKTNGKRCCGQQGVVDLAAYAKQELKRRGMYGPGAHRVSTSGCLGRCEEGPMLVIYPDSIFYQCRTQSDVDQIIEKHLIQGEKVADLSR